MPRNTLADLNNLLFEQIERLNDGELKGEELDEELRRAEGMTKVAAQIIENGELMYKTMIHLADMGYNGGNPIVPALLAPPGSEDGKH